MARLSVVVPFYGVERYLDRCLRSIAHQTFDDLEAVLVDDGSPDGSLAIAERWAERDARFRVVRQENQGLGPARNTGVRHASGDLLAFVDSDDLLARHAYQLLVGALDETGSDLAGGDARRFTSLWARDSYTHREPFAETRLATHVREQPSLVLDRMAWNKVYRRDFWDRHAFAFPAMLYEDYPVTLPAHVLARSVDVLKDPVYFWREREGGEPSITQARYALPNLRDRVASAEMVLGFIADQAPDLREHVEAHLFHVDVDAIVASMYSADAADRPEMLQLAQRLLSHVRPAVRAGGRPVERLQACLVERADVARIVALLEHRDLVGSHAFVRRVRRAPPAFEYDLPFRADGSAGVPRAVFTAQRPQVDLFARVLKSRWHRGRLRLRGLAHLPGVETTHRSRLTMWMQHTSGRVVPLEVQPHDVVFSEFGRRPAGFTVEINPFDLGRPPVRGRWSVMAEVRSQGLRRRGPVRVSMGARAGWLHPEPLGGDLVAQPMPFDGDALVLDVRRAGTRVIRLSAFSDQVELEGVLKARTSPADPAPTLVLSDGGAHRHELPVALEHADDGQVRFSVRIDLATLDPWPYAPDPMEEPVTWTVRLCQGGKERPLFVSHRAVAVTARSRTMQMHVGRNTRGNLGVTVGPIAAEVATLAWDAADGGSMTVHGTPVGGRAGDVRLQMHCQVDPDTKLVEEFATSSQGGMFVAHVDVERLVSASTALVLAPKLMSRPLVWRAVLVEDDTPGRVLLPRTVLENAPPTRAFAGAEAQVQTGRGSSFTVHVRRELSAGEAAS